ncbi:nucleotidyltransferase family protein [Lactiplantibacillus plantarum]|uniref:nucleotidyltransferase family protein n=1 Tax=Lactiplantibacillus plantarum TaxID=1590 RepID=UPI0039C1EA91
MTNEQRVIHIIKTTPALMTILQLIQDCHLKQGALAAGSIRNTVWQVLSGQPVMFNSDIDVVFFDPERPASDDLKIYQQLTDKAPQYQWQIKNEVYMAHYNFPKLQEQISHTINPIKSVFSLIFIFYGFNLTGGSSGEKLFGCLIASLPAR